VHDRSRKRPQEDLSALPASAAQEGAEEDEVDGPADDRKDPAAVALGRKGGLKGGKARAAKLTAERRREIAKRAALARWSRDA